MKDGGKEKIGFWYTETKYPYEQLCRFERQRDVAASNFCRVSTATVRLVKEASG